MHLFFMVMSMVMINIWVTAKGALTLRCDFSGEDDCRCGSGNGDNSCRVMTERRWL